MNIVINALSALRGGGKTYIKNLLQHIDNLDDDINILLISHQSNFSDFSDCQGNKVKVIKPIFPSRNIVFRVLWEFFYLPFLLKKLGSDSYYAPGGVMISLMPKGCKAYTALRNMLPFDERERRRFPLLSYSRFKLWILKYVYLISYRMSDGVIFISHHSRELVSKFDNGIIDKSEVIYHGLSPSFLEKANTASNLPGKPGSYYLYVSILDVYKAQKEIISAWLEIIDKEFDYPLVLVGPKYNQYGDDVVKLIESSGSDKVRFYGPRNYEELPALYQNSRALIFGSSCECCPNILLEKLASGKAVICSDIMPMPEFGQESVVYFNPYTSGSLKKAVKLLETEDNLRRYSTLAYERALDFDWLSTTKSTISFLCGKRS
ncbi:glycosyltransferase family 4 protein [Enterovibrio sp. 27052020O]|uniref:glycosyltransferase family 4 protein n=1 Tax=Enterovibrio sp. 27052020O TaxID=3241166 RepID=UPI0038906E5C